MPKLVIFKGENVENETRLAGRPVRLGRDNRNDIVLEDKSVSRFHAEVRPEGDRYVIVDLKSRNGVWVNGQQVKGKTALTLGAPVTLGAFEVTLEDDVPTGEFDEESPLLAPPGTMVNTPTDQSIGASRSATSPSMKAQEKSQRQMLVWGGAVVAVLLIAGVTFAVIRYRRPATTTTTTTVADATPPPAPSTPPPPPVVIEEPPPPPVDSTTATIDKHLDDARAAMGKNDLAGAREHVAAVLKLAPANQAAADLKRQIEGAATTPPRVKPPPPTTTTTPVTVDLDAPGIPRRPNEASADYLARVQRIDTNLKLGKSFVDKKDFMSALARFRLVAGEQKGYQDVEALIADTLMKQRVALELAMKYGQDSEKQSPPKWSDALRWYQNAVFIDPSATAARDKIGPLTERVTKEGTDAFIRGDVLRKRGENAKAIEAFKVAADLLPPNHEKKAEAQKWVETLKP